ncbi:hypothetical protein EVAR_61897_1 [Eumeta japonica]|uniref:Uncharacterized protein n=1 Tax=Eumeta variegata TaxID=151549 RepID=A0A4C1YPA9_EUMVA|nr:hypothetical protein EVAR_61897_1 [Eumeta japonica]
MSADEEPVITAEEEAMRAGADTTHATVLSSIDGNLQLEATVQLPPALPIGGIRINITKPISFLVKDPEEKILEDISPDNEPPPPGEEPELDYTLKPTLEGVTFSKQPPVQRGSELSGLCSIM